MMSRGTAFIVFIIYILIAFVMLNSAFSWVDLSFLTSIQPWIVAIGAVLLAWTGLKYLMNSMGTGMGY